MSIDKWDERFIKLAHEVAGWSKDPRTRVGAIIVDPSSRAILSTGYNGLPRGVEDRDERMVREGGIKYFWTEHAERNAIYNCARNGTLTLGATMYMPWFPCSDCARAIVQAGIARLVCGIPDFEQETWGRSWRIAREILLEAGVDFEYVS